VENSLWNRLWACRKTDYETNEYLKKFRKLVKIIVNKCRDKDMEG